MNTETERPAEHASGVRDLRNVPLDQIVRERERTLGRAEGSARAASAAFNSSI